MRRLCVDYDLVRSLSKMDALRRLDYGLIKSLSKMFEMTDAEKTDSGGPNKRAYLLYKSYEIRTQLAGESACGIAFARLAKIGEVSTTKRGAGAGLLAAQTLSGVHRIFRWIIRAWPGTMVAKP
jgi:hypothetical protein